MTETSWIDPDSWNYHISQWNQPKRSTTWAIQLLEREVFGSQYVIDFGCGGGATTALFAQRFPAVDFLGIDTEEQLIPFAQGESDKRGITNVSFEVGDVFDFRSVRRPDSVLMIQTISWLPDYKQALSQIFETLSPNWLFVTGLFYPGEIEAKTLINELGKGRQVFYNTYSIPDVIRFSSQHLYSSSVYPFEIDVDISKPSDTNRMSTYTVMSREDGIRYQISGPLLMNWHGILFKKKIVQ